MGEIGLEDAPDDRANSPELIVPNVLRLNRRPGRGRFVDVAFRTPFSRPRGSYLPTSTLRSTAFAMA